MFTNNKVLLGIHVWGIGFLLHYSLSNSIFLCSSAECDTVHGLLYKAYYLIKLKWQIL